MEFRILGPLEVVEDGRRLPLGGVKQRSLLAVLLLNANEVVSTDRLSDELWGESPPATVDKSIQVYVSRLRKALGEGRLVTRPPGYALQVDPAELDLARFEQLVAEADGADPDAAAGSLRAALDVWRGPPLADLSYERFAQPEITRLEELRWAAQEKRIDADLAAGRHTDLIGELEALVARHPLRERLRCQLMLALYRSGRQADALEVYRSARRDLADQLGLEPGDELKRLERAILQQDPDLELEREPARPRRDAKPAGLSVAGVRVPRRLLNGRRAMLAVGVVLIVAATVGGAIMSAGDDEGSDLGVIGNGVAVIAPDGSGVAELIEFEPVPGSIAVGEGAVWVINSELETLSRIDPVRKAVTGRVETRGVPTDIAAGGGAVWVGNGGGADGNVTVSVSRVDPRTLQTTHTLELPDRTGDAYAGDPSWGYPAIAASEDAVWAGNPDDTLSRIDPKTGKLVATIDVNTGPLAAADNGVWSSAGGETVSRIDLRTNRVAERVRVGSPTTAGIAVGAGSVWVAAERQGVVWRIEPGPNAESRSIDVGTGVTYVAYADGAVWAANYVDGTVARIDPRTNEVTSRANIGAAQALAAGEGTAWVSTAGGTQAGALPDSACEDLVAGESDPDVLIASDLPLQGPNGAGPRAMADAIRSVLREHGFRAGQYSVGYRSCDESTAQAGAFDLRRCAANANAYANADRLVAVIGPWSSYCAQVQLPTINRAEDGPPAVISPTNTHPGLTRATNARRDPDAWRGEPGVYYPGGVRNYFRLVPGDDLQAAALAVHARELGLERVYVVYAPESFWDGIVAVPFRRAAARLGVPVVGSVAYDAHADDYRKLAERVANSGADGVVLAGDPFEGGAEVLKAIRARMGTRVTIMGSFLFSFASEVLGVAGPAAHGLYATTLDLPRGDLPGQATTAARHFARNAGVSETPEYGVLEAGQATELVLAAIARSDGTRASVIDELKASRVRRGILGSFRFDENGDITPATIPIVRIAGPGASRGGLSGLFEGAELERVVRVLPELVE